MERKWSSLTFLLLLAFITIFIPFTYHGFSSEIGEEQHTALLALRDRAIDFQVNETAFQYDLRANSWQWALQDDFTLMDGIITGIYGGVSLVFIVLLIFLVSEKVTSNLEFKVLNPKLFAVPALILVGSFGVYEIIAFKFVQSLTMSPIDISVMAGFAFLLSIITYLHFLLTGRIESFRKTKNDSKNYQLSVELEHKSWTQVLQSVVFASLFLIGGVLVTLVVNTTEIKDLFAVHNAIIFSSIQIISIIIFMTAIVVGIFLKILSYLGKLSDILKTSSTSEQIENTELPLGDNEKISGIEKIISKLDEIKNVINSTLNSKTAAEKIPFSLGKQMNEEKFYDSLKNAQPLAFLASLSIVVAAFTFSIEELPKVYPNAISAAFSFIFAFILSMISQLLNHKDWEKLIFYCKIGTYFFLAVGISYLIFIAYMFSNEISQIPQIFFAWGYGFIGITTTIWFWNYLKKIRNKERVEYFDKLTIPIRIAVSITAWVATVAKLTVAITGFEVDDKIVVLILTGELAVMGVISMGNDIVSIINKKFKK